MSDIYLDENTGDISIVGNMLRLTESDNEEVRQKVEIRLRTFREEWFMNINAGLPYFQRMLQKGTTQSFIDTQVKSATLNTNGVLAITRFNSEVNLSSRNYTAFMTVTTEEGAVSITFTT
jgi:hypothetical protein